MYKKFSVFNFHKFGQLSIGMLLSLILAAPVWASGGGGGLSSELPRRQVDETYEYGKAVFKGRVEGVEKIKYCIKHEDEVKKIKRSTIKPFRKGPAQDFALALYDCNAPDRLAISTVPREHVPALLYYFNKRYNLNLKDS